MASLVYMVYLCNYSKLHNCIACVIDFIKHNNTSKSNFFAGEINGTLLIFTASKALIRREDSI